MRLISTLGWTSKVVVEVANILRADENVVIYGYVDDTEKGRVESALGKVKSALDNVTAVKVNPMDFRECIETTRKYLSEDSVANITGGTKVMAFSLALNAAIKDIPVIYMVTENGAIKIKKLPITLSGEQRNFFRMGSESTAKEMLKMIINEYNGRARMKDIRDNLQKGYSTISDAKEKLKRANLVKELRDGREKIIVANNAAYLFMGDEP